MSATPLSEALTRLTALTLPAGPSVDAPVAAAAVERLRRAVRWADMRLEKISNLPQSAALVIGAPVEILDRRGAFTVAATALAGLTETHGLRMRPSSMIEAALVGRRVAFQLKGMWDILRGVRILVAPNVLTEARRFELDQTDWSRWVALRTGLTAVHHVQAPHLSVHLVQLLLDLPDRSEELVRFAALSNSLARSSMRVLTTVDLPSLTWIRNHDTDVIESAHAAVLNALTREQVDIDAAFAQVAGFTDAVVDARAVEVLLEKPENLPTLAEYANPTLWFRRLNAQP